MSASAQSPAAPSTSKGPWARAWGRFSSNGAALAGLAILMPILVAVLSYPLWWPFAPNDIDLRALNQGPGPVHWFGTDGVGRDILARLMQGGRISLTVAVVSVAISIVIGFLVGAIASFGGKVVDNGVMRLVDLAMTLPPVIFLLVLASIAGTGIVPTIVVISLLS
jgi:peptide/nickel transport system permease protein